MSDARQMDGRSLGRPAGGPAAHAGGEAASWRARRPAAIAKDEPACAIYVLLASHVSSPERLAHLRSALDSIGAQSDAPDAMVLSWYADDTLASQVEALLSSSRVKNSLRFRAVRQTRRLSQYQHLREALNALERELPPRDAPTSPWLLFCDDDDLWHPERTRLARLACAQASSEPAAPGPPSQPLIRAIGFGVYTYPTEGDAQAARTAADVDGAIRARHAAIWLGVSEIFQYAVRPSLLRDFLRGEPESVLAHRFADVRFATWMRQSLRGAMRELGANELLRLDRGERVWPSSKRAPAKPAASNGHAAKAHAAVLTEPGAEEWVGRNWLYFYRNQRQPGSVDWLGDLGDLSSSLASAGRGEGGGGNGSYERASTGRQRENASDLSAARRVLSRVGPAPSADDAARDLSEVTREIGRLRHHAELTSMMCLGFRNAEALAIAISEQAEPAAAEGAQQLLHDALKLEQRQLVRESLEALGHAQRRAELPEGTVEECLV